MERERLTAALSQREEDMAGEMMDAGATAYVGKTAVPDTLTKTMRECFRTHEASGELF